jgi:hypothetical protein
LGLEVNTMRDGEWPRSRFWLCHFLHNRHDRAPIDWAISSSTEQDQPDTSPSPASTHAIADWLTWSSQTHTPSRNQLLDWAIAQCPNDPAYVQSLRLFIREEQHHQVLIKQWLSKRHLKGQPAGGKRAATRKLVRPLGLRFELSLLLLTEIASRCLNEITAEQVNDPALLGLLSQIMHDQQCHIAFHSERLTTEFADFNFIRRNLRRWRMRTMMGTLLTGLAIRHRPLLDALGVSASTFMSRCWQQFNNVLEHVTPYHREKLAATLHQHEHRPYDKPAQALA